MKTLSSTKKNLFKKSKLQQALIVALCGLSLPALAVTETDKSNDDIQVLATTTVKTQDKSETSYTIPSMASATGLNLSVRETPQSVSVVTSQLMQDQNLQSLTDVVINAPGLSAKELDSSRQVFSARGFDIDDYQFDGVSVTMISDGEDLIDTAIYERIEIVRGATGLLTGAGNPSATINLVRKRADSKEYSAQTSITLGSWNTVRAMTDMNSPLNETGSIRARTVLLTEHGGSNIDLATHKKNVMYGVVEADLTKRTLLSIGASYQDHQPTGTTWGGLPAWHSNGERSDWDRSKTVGTDWSFWSQTNENYFANLSHELNHNWQLKLSLNRIKASGDRKLLYLYGQPDKNTGLGLESYASQDDTSRVQDNINLQLNGSFSWLNRQQELVFGINHSQQDSTDFSHDAGDLTAVGNFNDWQGDYDQPTWGARYQNVDTEMKQQAIFAATRLSISDSFSLILGGRYSDWREKGTQWGDEVDFGDSDVFTPYAGALYDVTDNHTLYASYTDIFKPQNEQDSDGNYLDPLIGSNYEIGLKSEFFDGALNTSVALFKIDQDNFAVEDKTLSTIEKPVYYSDSAKSEGFEVEAVGEVLPGWNVTFSYSQYTAENADGEVMLTNHPRKQFKFYNSYNFMGNLNKLTIAGGFNWQDSNYTDTSNPVTGNNEKLKQEAYALVNLMARYDISNNLTAQLNIDNLLDKKYYSQIGFYDQLAYGKPRSVNLNLSYQF